MKKSTVRLQGIATAAILFLLMLGAGAHAQSVTSTTTTATSTAVEETTDHCTYTTTTATVTTASTATTETQSQTGNVETAAQEQTGANETCGANNQVGPDEAQGDNVNVVELDQGEQGQINGAEADTTIAGDVQVNNDTSVSSSVTDSRFSLTPSLGANGALDISISGQNVTGPRAFIVTLSTAQDPTTHTLQVTLDGKRVTQASSLGEVLHPSSTAAEYIVTGSSSGYQLLVSVPHFSTHLLAITPLAPGPIQGFYPISWAALIVAALSLTAIFAFVFATRKRICTLRV